ncbi:MAG: DUF1800 family protein [Betaproteobacteria bacterium]|nr:DUF1800 family protein [Betaproteobacteria bacterium]
MKRFSLRSRYWLAGLLLLSVATAANSALTLDSVVSRKSHGSAGSFDVVLDTAAAVNGNVSVEPRDVCSGHSIVFRFNEPITVAGSVTAQDVNGTGIGTVSAAASGNNVVVSLSDVADNRRVRVALSGVNGVLSPAVSVGFLLGDADNSRVVNAADVSAVRARSGYPASAANFRHDFNCSGTIVAGDIALARARLGNSLAAGAAPTVSLSAPASGNAGSAASLAATAAVTGATITRVDFYEGNTKIGERTASPYTLSWTPFVDGPAVLTARAYSSNGLFAISSPVTMTVQPFVGSDAARLLAQTTFGATQAEINRVTAMTPAAYLEEQFNRPQTMHLDTVRNDPNYPTAPYSVTSPSIWKQYFEANDQLRQRMVFALSQIMVISMNNNTIGDQACSGASYLDLLGRNAFGNFRTLLKDITLSPAMGEYLDMKGSAKADPVLNSIPSENYARELMQLFSIGTVMLNQDGSVQFGGDGKPIDTYSETDAQEVARALTGWHFAGQNQTLTWRWLYPDVPYPSDAASAAKACTAWSLPMEPWTASYRSADDKRNITGGAHDTGAKTLLTYPGSTSFNKNVPANQTPMQDIDSVVDNIFNHPNVGPFIGELLIQRLVTSNPSGAYVSRVAAAFNNNGSGVRGDMKAVIRAILLDPEARLSRSNQPSSYGKLREPVLRFTHLHRAFGGVMLDGNYANIYDLGGSDSLGQSPLRAPSVFNFYAPDFSPTGPLSQQSLYGPEFGITNSATISGFMDFSKYGVIGGFGQGNTSNPNAWIRPNYDAYIAMASTPATMVDALNILLLSGSMSLQFRTKLIDVATKLTDSNSTTQSTERFKTVLWLILNSPEYSIQK